MKSQENLQCDSSEKTLLEDQLQRSHMIEEAI